jgi:hypothetical protein
MTQVNSFNARTLHAPHRKDTVPVGKGKSGARIIPLGEEDRAVIGIPGRNDEPTFHNINVRDLAEAYFCRDTLLQMLDVEDMDARSQLAVRAALDYFGWAINQREVTVCGVVAGVLVNVMLNMETDALDQVEPLVRFR